MPPPEKPAQSAPAWLGLLVLLAVLIAVNVVARSVRLRADVTEEKLFTLSPAAADYAAKLDIPVTLKFYRTAGNQIPVPLKQYHQRVTDLLRAMERASDGRLVVELYDPKPDSEEEEWAQRYGLLGQPVSPDGLDGLLYMGLVAVSGTREAAIPFLAPNAEAQLEYNVARLVHEVVRREKPKVGVMSNLPVMGIPRAPMMRGRPPETGWIALRELRRHFEVSTVPADSAAIPGDLTALLVIHPARLPPATAYAIDQFVLRGGRLIVLQDPLCLAQREANPELGFNPQGSGSHLNDLTAAWGVTMDGEVVADPASASPVAFGNGQSERMPAWLTLGPERLDTGDVLTANLRALMMPFAGGFRVTPVEGVTITPLATTSPDTVLIDAFRATTPGSEKMRDAASTGALPLIVRLQGVFPSAFPGGAPPALDGSAPAPAPEDHLATGNGEGVVLLVSDVDFMHDPHAFRVMNMLGQSIAEFANDNFSLLLGLVEQATGDAALVGLRSRGLLDRSFERVRELEIAARARWEAEELKLMDRLQETQRRLGELQAARADDGSMQVIISPEQQAELDRFRELRFETQQQLKDVRRNLRSDIERLGVQVKVINFAAVPLLVAVYGMARGWRRRRG
jgi:ABC-type uncharacterized transport system involved in gliding motility auxiliary subunit